MTVRGWSAQKACGGRTREMTALEDVCGQKQRAQNVWRGMRNRRGNPEQPRCPPRELTPLDPLDNQELYATARCGLLESVSRY